MPQTEEDVIETTEEGDEDDEDQSWVLDSLVGFLKSPLWSSSLNNFVDQMSVVFEPDDIEDREGNVEHRPEYESVFKQYRSLVDQLITSHMVDLGISEEQFAKACEMAEGILASKLKSVLFEELWAAENFEVFVRLMARRNVELQLEALDTLAQRYGLVYDVFVPIGTSAKHFLSEEHVMREAILRSLDDLDLDHNEEDGGEAGADILSRRFSKTNKSEEAAAKADQANKGEVSVTNDEDSKEGEDCSSNTAEFQRDKARLEEVRQRVDQKMYKALQSALSKEVAEDEVEEKSEKKSETSAEPVIEEVETAETPLTNETQSKESEEAVRAKRENEIKKRAQHLREQRDRIIQMKQKERTEKISKYLIKEKEKLKNQPRPKTARRPESAMAATASEETAKADQQSESDSKELAYRKTLAARLKAEVIFGGK